MRDAIISVPQTPGGIHTVFKGSLRDGLNTEEVTDRFTTYPLTSHGGPVMATPGNFQQHFITPLLTNPAVFKLVIGISASKRFKCFSITVQILGSLYKKIEPCLKITYTNLHQHVICVAHY